MLNASILLLLSVFLAQPQRETVLPTGDIPLARLVDLSAEMIDASIEYDASVIRGSTTLRLSDQLATGELWTLTNELLAARGFTTVRRSKELTLVSVVKVSDAARLTAPDVAFGSIPEPVPGFVSVGLVLQHITPTDFIKQIEPMLTPSVGKAAVAQEPGAVRIADFTTVVRRVLSLASVIDHPDAVSKMEFVSLDSLPPAEVMRLVSTIRPGNRSGAAGADGTIFEGPDGRSVIVVGQSAARDELRAIITRLDENAHRESRLYSPASFSLDAVADLIRSSLGTDDQGVEIVEDELTSTLQVTASPVKHEQIAALLERLGSVPADVRRPFRTFPVRNRDVEEVAALIRDLIQVGVLEAGVTGRGVLSGVRAMSIGEAGASDSGGVGRGAMYAGEYEDDERIKIAVDRATSLILAIGEPRDLDRIADLIAEMDVRPPQVMLEVLMVSLSDGKSQDFGIELQRLLDDAGAIVGLTSLFGISDLGLGGGDSSSVLGSGSGGTAVILDPGDFSVVIRALENISDGRALSIPRVLVNNNESGTINSTVEEPFLSTNASDTVATTSFGGSSAAGTQVNVTPQIAEGDHILLQYSISLSSFVGESADPALPPSRQQNSISSRATIPDGYTIVVGGIEIQSDAEAETRVPFLGQIPGIGELFKSRSKSNSRSRFYAFIKPTILRHDTFEDLKHISDPIRSSLDIDGDYPVLLPRVIR